jgi:polyphosphate glucokinase
LGVDVGGSSIKFALVTSFDHARQDLRSVPTPMPANTQALVASICAIAATLPEALAIGVALPSVVQRGVVRTAANLDQDLIGEDVGAALHHLLQKPVVCLNDADAAGLAEIKWGAAKGIAGTVMMLTFGTGIGSALFVDGRLFPNSELGHLEMQGGEAEHWASARVRTAESLSWPAWAARVNDYLDRINALFWPDLIVLGGGISEDFAEFEPLLRSRAPVRRALLGAAAGVAGAALAARQAK